MKSRQFFPELEGIRAYAFLLVFLSHYMTPTVLQTGPRRPMTELWYLIVQVTWAAVPVFFVLSGFLITGILYDTRGREGYFSVFYKRRAIRILPLYYVVLAVFAALSFMSHAQFLREQLWFLVYLENVVHAPDQIWWNMRFCISHLWSLAVEEQFYIVWPLVIWLVPDRKALLRVCYGLIGVCCITRLCWPLFHLGYIDSYSHTATRCDAILMGAVLALHTRAKGFQMSRMKPLGIALVATSTVVVYARVLQHGDALPYTYVGLNVMVPVINLLALGLVLLCMVPGSMIQRLCRARWACYLGSMSYSLYLFHEIEVPWVQIQFAPWLSARVGHGLSRIIVLVSVAMVTYAVARLTYRFVELPGMRAKERLKYGPLRPTPATGTSLGRLQPGDVFDIAAATPERTYAAARSFGRSAPAYLTLAHPIPQVASEQTSAVA